MLFLPISKLLCTGWVRGKSLSDESFRRKIKTFTSPYSLCLGSSSKDPFSYWHVSSVNTHLLPWYRIEGERPRVLNVSLWNLLLSSWKILRWFMLFQYRTGMAAVTAVWIVFCSFNLSLCQGLEEWGYLSFICSCKMRLLARIPRYITLLILICSFVSLNYYFTNDDYLD